MTTRWFCVLLTLLFAVKIGLPTSGMAAATPLQVLTAAETGAAFNALPDCCMDKSPSGQRQSPHCSADCAFSIVANELSFSHALQDYHVGIGGLERPRYVGAVFRPPID